jgi:hypothetical protein
MSSPGTTTPNGATTPLANGSGAAALLAAGCGAFFFAGLSIATDKSPAIKSLMNFYPPTGPLSGVITTAISAWLIFWIVLEFRWRKRSLGMSRVSAVAVLLLVLSLLLTFPPLADFF